MVEEVWQMIAESPSLENTTTFGGESDPGDELLAMSAQAAEGVVSNMTIKLKCHIHQQSALVLLDSGSSHNFLSEQQAVTLAPWKLLRNRVKFKLVDRGELLCTHEIVLCPWLDHQFYTTFKILPLKCYDAILGIGQQIKLQGLSDSQVKCLPASGDQVHAMHQAQEVWCVIQVYALTDASPTVSLPQPVQQLVDQYTGLFTEPNGKLPSSSRPHTIPLLPGTQPFRLRPYRYTPAQKIKIEQQVAKLLQNRMIPKSTSPFASPVLLVKKKSGEWRMCVDYRRLNAYTIKNKFPLPIIEELFEELVGATWFTTLDLRSGFHQIMMAEEDQYKTAFQTHFGHFEYKVMPYGLTGGPATFQSTMNYILASLLMKCVVVFIDDILIYSKTWEDHLSHIKQQQLKYLGHIISAAGVATDPSKIVDVQNWPVPQTAKELRGFLGLAGYYRRFRFLISPKPLWLRLMPLTKALEQYYSKMGRLYQSRIGKNQGLSAYEKESLAILMAIDHWRSYLQPAEFIIQTDYRSLANLDDQRLHTYWQQKALTKLLGLRYKICYKKGSVNNATDALSCMPHIPTAECAAVSVAQPIWLQTLVDSYSDNPQAQQLLTGLILQSPQGDYALHQGVVMYKGRIWLTHCPSLQQQVLAAMHSSPVGGPSGFFGYLRSYQEVFLLDTNEIRHQTLAPFVNKQKLNMCLIQACCNHFQCQLMLSRWSPWTSLKVYLLPRPTIVYYWLWTNFQKYAHFIKLAHPFTTRKVAKLFLDNVYRLHGMPMAIVSNRDRVFTSHLWQELFKQAGTTLRMSSAYHPQSDGQTERVNRSVETFLRCFGHACPVRWSDWISQAEYWYNTNYHSALGKFPFEVLYGQSPRHFGISGLDDCVTTDLATWLKE
ncbi:LOW QUALITY PROTEIN: hypothetical protein U9M48_008336 [Paspalum notatum var. saurae]|uniref:RNA-directed DNA polymerase n=1 Tax=Paspalum notatum var. saurae TaxID=547442 RepID=A0AAQ3SPN0_PASNO